MNSTLTSTCALVIRQSLDSLSEQSVNLSKMITEIEVCGASSSTSEKATKRKRPITALNAVYNPRSASGKGTQESHVGLEIQAQPSLPVTLQGLFKAGTLCKSGYLGNWLSSSWSALGKDPQGIHKVLSTFLFSSD